MGRIAAHTRDEIESLSTFAGIYLDHYRLLPMDSPLRLEQQPNGKFKNVDATTANDLLMRFDTKRMTKQKRAAARRLLVYYVEGDPVKSKRAYVFLMNSGAFDGWMEGHPPPHLKRKFSRGFSPRTGDSLSILEETN